MLGAACLAAEWRKMYYTSLKHIQDIYDKKSRQSRFMGTTLEEFKKYAETSKEKIKELLGLHNMENAEANPEVLERIELENGIIREKVVITTEPDVQMPMYILIPQCDIKGVYIALCGHQGGGKLSVAGRYDIPAIKEKIEFFNYDYGMQLAKEGYVAVCPDSRGFDERREEKTQGDGAKALLGCSCFHLAHLAEPLGQTVAGMCVWDMMQLITYLENRKEWDISDLGIVGFSGGGMLAMWLAVLDLRVKRTIISGYMYGYKESLLELNGNCNCNYIPHLWEHFDMGDIASLIAPRKLVIQSGKLDHLNGRRGIANVVEQVDIIREAYELYGKSDNIRHDVFDGPHKWYSENLKEYLL